MILRKVRWAVGLVLLLISLGLLVWGSWPLPDATRRVPISVSTSGNVPAALPEQRNLVLSWPVRLRVGDTGSIRLALEPPAQNDLSPTIQPAPGQAAALYDLYNIVIESRLELPGVQIAPEGEVREALTPGRGLVFRWSLRPIQAGSFRGAVWLHLRLVPKDGGPEQRQVLTAQQVEIQTVEFLGLGGNPARLLGALGILIGAALSLDGLFHAFRSAQRGPPGAEPETK